MRALSVCMRVHVWPQRGRKWEYGSKIQETRVNGVCSKRGLHADAQKVYMELVPESLNRNTSENEEGHPGGRKQIGERESPVLERKLLRHRNVHT